MEYYDVNQTEDNANEYKTSYKEYTIKSHIKSDCITYHTDISSKLLEKSNVTKSKERDHSSKTKCFTQRQFPNECPGGSSCNNYHIIKQLETEIQKLVISMDKLTKVNEYLNFTLNQKNQIFKSIISDSKRNQSINQDNILTNHGNQPLSLRIIKNISGKSMSQGKIKAKNNHSIHRKYPSHISLQSPSQSDKKTIATSSIKKQNTITSRNKPLKLQKTLTEYNDRESLQTEMTYESKDLTNLVFDRAFKRLPTAFLHYDNVKKTTHKHVFYNSAGVSFLALSNEQLDEIANNSSIKNLIKLTQSDEEFLQFIRNGSRETHLHYCKIISSLVKDFQSIISLIKRIKMSLASSFNLSNSILSTESPLQLFLDNACLLFDCEQASLYLYDTISDKLRVYSTDKNNSTEIQGKYEGLIGSCFLKGEKVKIDYLSQDSCWKKDIKYKDKVRNLMCYPILDKNDETIGVIEVLNKQKEHFDTNDQEFFGIFTNEISIILQNMENNEIESTQLKRLRIIVNYSIEISGISSILLFLKKTEVIIKSLFSSPNVVIFLNNSKGLYNSSSNEWVKRSNIGIINHVIKKKECYGCSKIINCKYYNTLIDMITDCSLVTYPIINHMKADEVIAVIQVQYYHKLCLITEKPKKNDMDIFKLIEQCFISWYERNKESVDYDKL